MVDTILAHLQTISECVTCKILKSVVCHSFVTNEVRNDVQLCTYVPNVTAASDVYRTEAHGDESTTARFIIPYNRTIFSSGFHPNPRASRASLFLSLYKRCLDTKRALRRDQCLKKTIAPELQTRRCAQNLSTLSKPNEPIGIAS